MNTVIKNKFSSLFLGSLLLLALWIRLPFVFEGSPYLYREDEAHHFNRIINMMKSGDLNPHYFHKPSLHFYLRLPVASFGFLTSVKKGEIRDLKEIVTSDPFGVADYSFSTSHPRILHISRAFSLALSLASILLTLLICQQMGLSKVTALAASLLLAISPAAISESAVIGVDNVMTLFCLWTVYLGLRALQKKDTLSLFWCATAAGLAISSKYNALPVLFVPVVVLCFQKNFTLERCLTASLIPFFAFLAASPYIIFSLPEFLNQFAYEIWHYGVAGHVGHMAEPGLPQLLFYLNWLANDALGIVALVLSFLGLLFLSGKLAKAEIVVAFSFPALFFLLMLAQKANFERNMIVIIPFACILAASALELARDRVIKKLIVSIFLISLVQPLYHAISLRLKTQNIPESRLEAAGLIEKLAVNQQAIAVDGSLQIQRRTLELPGVDRVELAGQSDVAEYLLGYKYLLVHGSRSKQFTEHNLFKEITFLEGSHQLDRIVQNPSIAILEANQQIDPGQIPQLSANCTPKEISLNNTLSFESEADKQLWFYRAAEKINLNLAHLASNLKIKLYSPWKDQKLTFIIDGRIEVLDFASNAVAEAVLKLDPAKQRHEILIISSKVNSPKSLGISSDVRKLAFAVKEISVY